MKDRWKFLGAFAVIGFLMKYVSEMVHEILGHGLFVVLFGGSIESISISVFWPYEFSQIAWSGNFQFWQLSIIQGAGVLIGIFVSLILTFFLLIKPDRKWYVSFPLFWLSFWTFLSSTGYLLIGSFGPFGDVQSLIASGILSRPSAFVIGSAIFLVLYFPISLVLRRILMKGKLVKSDLDIRIPMVTFWALVPVLTLIVLIKMDISIMYFPLSIAPLILVPLTLRIKEIYL